MIEVEICGPVAKKEYTKLNTLLKTAGENFHAEKHICVEYLLAQTASSDIADVLALSLEQKNSGPEIRIKKRRSGEHVRPEETSTVLAHGEFSHAVKMLSALGYTKGMVSMREHVCARFGGADFTLTDPGEDFFYYKAQITAHNPTEVAEAQQKLASLAKKLKLPIWGQNEMFSYMKRLNERVNYLYDYEVQGAEHFTEKFGV